MLKASKITLAKRLAPLSISLAALMVVAACARTKGGSEVEITNETAEETLQTALQKTGNFDHLSDMFTDKNMALSAKVLGATLAGQNRTTQGDIDLQFKVVIGDHEPIIAQGTANKVGADLKIKSPAIDDGKYKISANCGDEKCVLVSVNIVEQAEQEATPMTLGSEVADEVKADGSTTATSESAKPVEAPVVAPVVAPKATKQTVPVAHIVMLFRTTLKDAATETKAEETARQGTFTMFWQTPSSQKDGMLSRDKFSFEQGVALKTGKATAEQIKADVAAAKVKVDAAPATEGDEATDVNAPATATARQRWSR